MRVSLTIAAAAAALAVTLTDLVRSSAPVSAQVANETALNAKVTQFIRKHEKEASIPLEKSAKVSTRLIDLNADGTPEALVIIRDANSCGSRGCTAFVLDLSGPTANSIGDLIAETLEALPSRTGQWRDISVNGRRIRFRGGTALACGFNLQDWRRHDCQYLPEREPITQPNALGGGVEH